MLQVRYRRILWFFARVILGIIGWDLLLPRLGLRALSRRTRPARLRRAAVQFRLLAIEMGGVMIKVGQFLSARLDVLPPEITDELVGLQDEVLPEPFEAIQAVLEAEMNAPLESVFSTFNPVPLAAASIGQVHQARIRPDNRAVPTPTVVVKVQRPDIPAIVETDLSALRVVGKWISYYPPIRKRADVPALLAEFSRSLYEETDYLKEGSNAETFAANFAGRAGICVPHVYWDYTTRRVLTLEEIQAIKITDYARIEAAGIPRADVAARLFDTYLKQIFEDRFFHADPHPGNLFVLPGPPAAPGETPDWKLVFVDFGMTGTVSANQLRALREILIAVGTQDIPRLIRSYQLMGVLLPNADIPLLEKATQMAFEQFWGKSTTEIVNLSQQEAAAFASEFSDLLYEMPFQVPENLILLGRCLSILSGICTGLDPDFNVWQGVMPYARTLIEAENGGVWGTVLQEALDMLRTLAALPGRTNALMQRLEKGQLEVQVPELKGQLTRLERQLHRLSGSILFAAFFFGSIQLYLAQFNELALAAFIFSLLALIWMLTRR